jgi:hypothetical protein
MIPGAVSSASTTRHIEFARVDEQISATVTRETTLFAIGLDPR